MKITLVVKYTSLLLFCCISRTEAATQLWIGGKNIACVSLIIIAVNTWYIIMVHFVISQSKSVSYFESYHIVTFFSDEGHRGVLQKNRLK